MKKIEKLIPFAITAVETFICTDTAKTQVPKPFNGYVSSFGASIITSGVLPTLAFFGEQGKPNKGTKEAILPAIYLILEQTGKTNHITSAGDKNLFHFALYPKDNDAAWTKREILDASIALKLALRTFGKDENFKEN